MIKLSTSLCAPRPVARVAGLLLAACFMAGQLLAADFYWSGLSGGSWNIDQDANWFSGGHPSSGDNLYFNNTGGTCGTSGINTPYCNYGAGAWFGNLIAYACSGGITWEGDQTYLYKFENQDTVTLQAFANLANRTGPDTALQINPVNGPIIVTNVIMQNGQQLQVYGGNALTVNGVISESGSPTGATLVILQGATVVLKQAATYTGDTFANSGTLRLSANNALANSGNYLRLGDTANALSANLNLDGGLNLATPINVRSGNSGTMIIANTAGTAGPATYSGNLYLDHDVTLYANTNGALGGLVFSGTALDLKNQTLTVDGPGTNLISGVLTNSTGNGAVIKNGAGTLTLSGANTYSGPTTIGGGTLNFNSIGNVGAASSALGAPATVTNGTINIAGNGTLIYSGGAASSDRIINMTGTSIFYNSGSGLLALTGGIIASGGSGITFRGAQNITETGVVGISGTVSRTDAGVLTLNNAANSFGNVTISQGTISVDSIANGGVNSSLGKGTTITLGQSGFNNTGKLQFTGASGGSSDRAIAIMSTSGNNNGGIIENTVSGQTLTLSGNVTPGGTGTTPTLLFTNAGNFVMSGFITNSPGTNLSLTMLGTGTNTLSGANAYTGGTTNLAGTMVVQNNQSAANGGWVIGPASANTTTVNFNSGSTVAVASGKQIQIGNTTSAGSSVQTLSVAGAVTNAGTLYIGRNGILNLNSGAVWSQGGDMSLNGQGGFNAAMNVNSGSSITNSGVNTVKLNGSSANSGTATLTIDGTGSFTTATGFEQTTIPTTGYGRVTLSNGGTVKLGAAMANLTTNVQFTLGTGGGVIDNNGFSTTLSGTATNGSGAALAGGISGAGNLTKINAGTLTLNGTNSYTGNTTIGAGTLTLAGSGSLGSGTYAGNITNNGAFIHNSVVAETLSGVISGTGSVTQQSGGDLTLAGANTYSGGTTLAGAITRVKSSNTALGSGVVNATANAALATQSGSSAVTLSNTVSINSGVTLSIDSGYANLTFNGPITNSGNFATTSSGTTTLNGTNTYTGTTTDGASAVLTIGGTGSLGSGIYNNTISIGNTFNYNSTVAQTLGGIISGGGAGGLNVGAGTLTLTNANTYTAPTFINAGTLALSGGGSIASTPRINIASGGVFDVSALLSTFALGASQTLTGGRASGAATDLNGNYTSAGTNNIAGSGTNGILTINGNLSLTGGGLIYDLFTPAAADLITLSGASRTLSLSGTTVVTVNGSVTNGTYTLINGINSIPSGGAANLALAASATNTMRNPTATFITVAPTITMTISSGATNLFWQGNTSSAWDVNTTANWTNSPGATSDKFFNQDKVVFGDTAAATTSGTNVTISTAVYPSSVAFSNSSKIISLGGSGSISGVGTLTKAGTSLVIISNANAYTGGTLITAGTLQLATNNPNGLGLGPLTMSGGVLDLNSNNLSTLSLSGTGGTITNTIITGTANTRTLTVNQSVSNSFAGLILKSAGNTTNDISLVKNGSGYLLLTGASTYTGITTVNAGTLEATNASSLAAKAYTVASGATFKLGYSATSGSFGVGNGVTVNGVSAGDPSGLYLVGGKNSTFGSTLTLQTAPSTVRAYGTGTHALNGADVNNTHLSVAAAASGSVIDPAVNISAGSYGYRISVTSGANNANGDLLIGGVISGGPGNSYAQNGQSVHLQKEGTGSLLLTNASTYTDGLWLKNGKVILSGGNNRLPIGAGVVLGDGGANSGVLQLNGVNQTFTNLITYGTGTGNAIVGGSATVSTLTLNNAGVDNFTGVIGGTGANQNSLALVKTGAGQLILSGRLTYTNNTTISAGTVLAGALTNVDGATLSVVDVAGALSATNLTLGTSTGSTVAITGFAGATAAPIVATNFLANGVTTITLAGTFISGQYPLIQFLSGTIGGGGSFTVQQAGLPRGVTAAIVTNVPNNSIDVVLTAFPLMWVGATNGVNVATWDNGTTTNWSLLGSPNYFTNGDNVQIDDSAIGSTTLNLAATVSPFTVLVTNNANNYTFSAAGAAALTGGMGLTKKGTGLLTITESNSFTGGVIISGGAVNIQNGYALNTNTVTVANGTELELQGGINVPSVTVLTLGSAGTNNTGGLRNLSGNNTFGGPITLGAASRINSDSGTLTLTNGVTAGVNLVTLGGSGNVAISTATVSGSSGLMKDGGGTNIWSVNPSISSGGVTVNAGTLQINNGNFGGTFTPLITVNTNSVLWGNGTHSTGGGATLVLNKGTWLMSGEDYKQNLTLVDSLIAPGPNPVSSGGELRVGYAGGTGNWTWYVSNSVAGSVINSKLNTIGSGINLTLNVARGAAAADLTLNGPIINGGTITIAGNGITQITFPTNNNTGTTTVSGGTLLLTGALGTNATTVATNATLTGTGVVNGAVAIQFGGTVQPGLGTDTSSLAVSNALTLAGNALFVLNRTNAQNSSRITGITTATYGGALTVNNTGDALLPGDAFTLFQAASYVGGFTNVVLPALSSPLVWNTNNLAVNGSIVVQKAPTSLTLISSENPSGFSDSIAFTANVTPSVATGTIAFQTNGVTFDTEPVISGSATSVAISVLPRGTNAIAAIYSGDAGYLASTTGLNQVVTNHPPTAGNANYYRGAVASYKITISELMTNAADVDGDSLTVSFGTSTNGINLIISGGLALYSNPNLVNDQLTYTVNDGFGGSATATVNIASAPFLVGQNATVAVTGSTATVSFAGIPGYSYGIQRSTNMVDWATIITTNAPSGGLFNYTDDFSDLGGVPGSAYYRLQWNP